MKLKGSIWEFDIQNRKRKLSHTLMVALLSLMVIPTVMAEEKIIQQEAISFEKCLKVITKSENKLSSAPEITDVSDQKRTSVFMLVDGTIKIICDGLKGEVTVLTKTN